MNTALRSTAQAARPLRLPAAPAQVTVLSPGEMRALDPQLVQAFRAGLWRAAPAAGWRLVLEVTGGALWLTWPGCREDRYLQAGDALALPAEAGALAALLLEPEPRLAGGAAHVRLHWRRETAVQSLGDPAAAGPVSRVREGAGIDSAPSWPTPHPLLNWLRGLMPAWHPAHR